MKRRKPILFLAPGAEEFFIASVRVQKARKLAQKAKHRAAVAHRAYQRARAKHLAAINRCAVEMLIFETRR